MKIKLSEKEVEMLLGDLCISLGFCLPSSMIRRIMNNPPTTVDRFTDTIYRCEGMDPMLKSEVYKAVHARVTESFEKAASSETV